MSDVIQSPLLFSLMLALASFLTVAVLGKPYIDFLRKRYMGQYIREDGPQSHQAKAGTPTLGGLLIFTGTAVGLTVYLILDQQSAMSLPLWITVLIGLVFGGLGFIDDYLKISKKKNKGVSGYTKLAIQLGLGMAVGLYVAFNHDAPRTNISLFFADTLELDLLYPVFATLLIAGCSNAVNLTDGLDGLASSTMIAALVAAAWILHITGYPELSLFCAILIGACAGFLVFNKNPAKIFMGDTGSLALGGVLGAMMVMGDAELWLLPVGGVFLAETLSVMLQVASFKTTGKRIFKMAPLHHHFELSGLSEVQVVWLFFGAQTLLSTLAIFLAIR